MRRNFGSQSWLYPMPVLIIGTYDENGSPDAMNAAWGGIHNDNQIGICIAPSHKTTVNLMKHKAFTVSIGTASQVAACDYVGLVSGKDAPDKVAKAGWHAEKAGHVDAPLFAELPMALECRLLEYNEKTGAAVGEIVNVCADEAILAEDGKIDPARLEAISFDPVRHTYLKLGEVVGKAFKDGARLK